MDWKQLWPPGPTEDMAVAKLLSPLGGVWVLANPSGPPSPELLLHFLAALTPQTPAGLHSSQFLTGGDPASAVPLSSGSVRLSGEGGHTQLPTP